MEARRPGELVGLDCFYVGSLSGTKGAVWQYTAIDVASGFAWAELHASPRNPRAEHCSQLVERVATEFARAGWRLEAVNHGQRLRVSGRRLHPHTQAARCGAAGDPRRSPTDERAHRAPATNDPRGVLAALLARALVPKLTALAPDLVQYLAYYNFDRAHTAA